MSQNDMLPPNPITEEMVEAAAKSHFETVKASIITAVRAAAMREGLSTVSDGAARMGDHDLLRLVRMNLLLAAVYAQRIRSAQTREDLEFAIGALIHDESLDHLIAEAE